MTQQALAKTNQQPQNLRAVEPNRFSGNLSRLDMRELKELGEMFHASGSFSDVKSAAQAMVKIHAGHELGFSPIQSMAGIHFFQGKVAIGSTLLASLIKDSGRYDYEILEHDATKCSIQFKQNIKGVWEKMGVPVTYTVEDAKNANLTGNPAWKNHPADMLFASCVRKGFRRYTPNLVRGTVSDEPTPYEAEIDATEIEQNAASAEPAIDGEIVIDAAEPVEEIQAAPEAAGRDRTEFLAEVKDLCQQLNKAGDSIKWSAVNLTQYINDLFSVEDGLDALGNDSFTTLVDDLKGRLAELNKAA